MFKDLKEPVDITAELDGDFYDDNFDSIEPEEPLDLEKIPVYETDYEILPENDLDKYYNMYKDRIVQLENLLHDHRKEITKIERAIEIKDLKIPRELKIEKIKDLWEPSPDELLPKDIETCHKIIVSLRKLVRKQPNDE